MRLPALFPLALACQGQTYVPEPKPAASDYLVGAHYFPGWKQGDHYGWDKILPFPNRTPLLGHYDEGSPEVADWEMKWALEHGIRYFVYCWYRSHDNAGKPAGVESLRHGHAIHEGLFHARYADKFRFAIMWENQNGAGVASREDLFGNLLPFWIDTYFKRPGYLKIGNKPVLFVYDLKRLLADLGSPEQARAALNEMRARCRAAGFEGLVVLCEYRGADPEVLARIRDSGFDAAFAYCWHTAQRRPTPDQAIARQMELMEKQRAAAAVPTIPTATMGWDPLPWKSDNPKAPWLHPDKMTRWILSPEEFQSLLVRIKAAMDAAPAGSLGRSMLLLDNWNEWGEGHYLAPHAAAGFGYLKAVREVFTRRNNRPDYRSPHELGLGPYDSRYQSHAH